MSTGVILAETDTLRAALFVFRHRVYVGELGGERLRSASGELRDDLDSVASNYAVLASGRVVGSLRVVDWSDFPAQERLTAKYGVESIVERAGARAVCHGGRLAVDKSMRGKSYVVDLLSRAVRDRVPRGVRFVVSDCSPELFPLYERIGFVRTGRDFVDPDFGQKWSMIWCMGDHEQMRRTSSPLLPVVSRFSQDVEGRAMIRAAYPAKFAGAKDLDAMTSAA
jgi:predicted GNAT family N-acyltransferase